MIRLLVCLTLVSRPCSLFAQEEDSGEKLVAVRVAILELNGDVHLKDGTTYSAGVFNELVASLRKQRVLERYQFFKLASIENRPASIQLGQEQPVVSGRTISPARGRADSRSFPARVANSYDMRETGSHVQAVSKVRDDGKILVELTVTSTQLKSIPEPEPDASAEIRSSNDTSPPSFAMMQCNTAVLLESGANTVVAAGGEDGHDKATRAYVIVSAEVE